MAAQGTPSTDCGRVQHVRDVLGHPRRRGLLDELASLGSEHVRFETLVDRVVSRGPSDRDAVASDLHHVHLPKLAELGVISYDTERRHVTHHTCRVADVLALVCDVMEAPDD